MKLPRAAKKMLLQPMVKMGLEAYKQGRDDEKKGKYDEENFKEEMKKLFDRNI